MTENSTRPSGVNGDGVSNASPLADDLLFGAEAIADFMFGKTDKKRQADANRRRVYHAAEKHGLPIFKIGATLCARKSTLIAWIAQQEQAA